MDAVGFNPRRFLFLKEKVDNIEETFMVKGSNEEVIYMFNRNVFGYESNDPLSAFLDGILYFSERELRVAQLLGNCRSDKEIAELLKIDENELNEIKNRISQQAKQIVRGY